jgi:hypothetical protein
MKFPAWYGISIGALIVLQWIFFLIADSVPELETAPWEIGHHMTAELLLAATLLTGGLMALKSLPWSRRILLVGLGMAIYSEINSPGYFAQRGQWTLVGMFAALLVGAIWSVIVLLKSHPLEGMNL